ncbi:putative short-chain dehydrogenases/reductase, partial [Aureobasidium melanogenum]
MIMATETVLVVGSTGNIGVSAVIGALHTKREVLAVVRNQESAEKLFKHVGTREGITIAEADITSEADMLRLVEDVKTGKLPAFQHVYAAAGGLMGPTPLHDITTEELRHYMNINFETNFFAYKATIPYLLEQGHKDSTWTLCTGGMGDAGLRAGAALTQGALYSLANVACRDLENTNVRFNEVYLNLRVEVDESAKQTGFFKASDFAKNYQEILARPEIRSARVSVFDKKDFTQLVHKKKRVDWAFKKDN